MAIRLPPEQERALAKKLGIAVRDPKARRTRIPHADHAAGLRMQLRALGLPQPTLEFRFHETRKWRYDLALVEQRILIDIDGGSWLPGKKSHTSGKGFERDRLKDCAATLRAWRVFRFTPKQIASGDAALYLAYALGDARGKLP